MKKLILSFLKRQTRIFKFLIGLSVLLSLVSCVPIHKSVQNGDLEAVRNAIGNGADLNRADVKGNTPLFYAVKEGQFAIADVLIENGANVNNHGINSMSLLIDAIIASQNSKIVKLLIRNNVYLNTKSKFGSTALHLAAIHGNLPIIELLINHGADLNTKNKFGRTALHLAAKHGYPSIGELMIKKGSDLNAKDMTENTALHIAVSYGHSKFADLLIDKKALLNEKNKSLDTPLHIAVSKGNFELIKKLSLKGADINSKNNKEMTPLLISIEKEPIKTISFLIKNGSDTDLKDKQGNSALFYAIKEGRLDVVKLLVTNNTKVNVKNRKGDTPMHYAAYRGHLNMVKFLIQNGAKTKVNNHSGNSPLHLIANQQLSSDKSQDFLDVVKILILNGSDINAKNKSRKTAFHYAKDRKNRLLIALMEKHLNEIRLQSSEEQKATNQGNSIVKEKQAKYVINSGNINTNLNISTGVYHALIIGNNNYINLPKLKTAQFDAKSVSNTLKTKYDFKVKLLLDATRASILRSLTTYRKTLSKRDNLLIYYAGHGWLDKDVDRGYWLPVDADEDDNVNWISNVTITDAIRGMQAKHVMLVADSCYSGKLTRGLNISIRKTGYLQRLAIKKARTVLTSGGLEPVMDSGGGKNSVFAKAFINALKDNNSILDGHTLFSVIRRPVILNSDQTPEYGDIRKAGHDGGDFLFIRTK
jgi:ankyrin repeat protein